MLNTIAKNIAPIFRKRSVRLAAAGFLVVIVILYGLVSFLIAQGVTKADRDPQEDHPSNYDLVFEDVEFPSRRTGLTALPSTLEKRSYSSRSLPVVGSSG